MTLNYTYLVYRLAVGNTADSPTSDSPRQLYDPNLDIARLHFPIPPHTMPEALARCSTSLSAHMLGYR